MPWPTFDDEWFKENYAHGGQQSGGGGLGRGWGGYDEYGNAILEEPGEGLGFTQEEIDYYISQGDYNYDGTVDVLDLVLAQNQGLGHDVWQDISETIIGDEYTDEEWEDIMDGPDLSWDPTDFMAPEFYDLSKSWHDVYRGGSEADMEDWWKQEMMSYAGDIGAPEIEEKWGDIWAGMKEAALDPEAFYYNPAEMDRIDRKYKGELAEYGAGYGTASKQAHKLGKTDMRVGGGLTGIKDGNIWDEYQRGTAGLASDYGVATRGYWDSVGEGITSIMDLAMNPSQTYWLDQG